MNWAAAIRSASLKSASSPGSASVDEGVGECVDDLRVGGCGLRDGAVRTHIWLPKGRHGGAVLMVARPMPPVA